MSQDNNKINQILILVTNFVTDFEGVKEKIERIDKILEDTKNKVTELEKRIDDNEKLLLGHKYSLYIIWVLVFVIFITMKT